METVSVSLFQELRGHLPGARLRPVLKKDLSLERIAFQELKPAELTLSCADGWYTNNHLVIWGVEPRANLDVFVDPLIQP